MIIKRLRSVAYVMRRMWWTARGGVSFGRGVALGSGVRVKSTDGAHIALGDRVVLERAVDLIAKFGQLDVGRDTFIGKGTVICARQSIKIGCDCLISEYVVIRDQNHTVTPDVLTRRAGFVCADVVIGNNVWIGAKATILSGVTIADNAVIGANALVNKDVPANSVAVGVPAKVVKQVKSADPL